MHTLCYSLVVIMLHTALLRWDVIRAGWRSLSAGFRGNMRGEGTILGSTLVVGAAEQGILFQHRAKVFGDHADTEKVLEAARRIE